LKKPRLEIDKLGITSNMTSSEWSNADDVDFSEVFVASAETTYDVINSKINDGRHIVFQPGVYNLTGTIEVTNPGCVLLGLGMATLVSYTGQTII